MRALNNFDEQQEIITEPVLSDQNVEDVDRILESVTKAEAVSFEHKSPLWSQLVELCKKYGRDDYAAKIRQICITVEDITNSEMTLPQIQQKLLKFGDVAFEMAIWKDIAKYLNLQIADEFKKWKAETEEKAVQEAIRIQFEAKVIDGNKVKALTNSNVTVSDNKIDNARMRLFPDTYAYYQQLLNYTSHIYSVASDILSILFKSADNHKVVVQTLTRGV